MGSRITRSINKNQRARPVTVQSATTAAKFLSILLYSISTIFVGYMFDIDLILDTQLKRHFSITQSFWQSLIENTFIFLFLVIASLLSSAFSHRSIQIKCSILCLFAQIILYLSVLYSSATLMIIGEVVLEVSNMGLIICVLTYIHLYYRQKNSPIFFIGFFLIHEMGIRLSLMLTPTIYENNLSAVYGIAMLFAILQLFCIVVVSILEKVYLMTKQKRSVTSRIVIDRLKIVTYGLREYYQYFPLFISVCLNQFLVNRLYCVDQKESSENTIFIMVSIAIVMGLCFLDHATKRNLIIIQVICLLAIFLVFYYSEIGRTIAISVFSGFNIWVLSIIVTSSHFNLLLGIILFFTFFGRLFPTSTTLNNVLILLTFQIAIMFLFFRNRKKISSQSILYI